VAPGARSCRMNAGSAAGDHLAHMSFCYLLIAARHGGGPLGMSLVSRAADAAPDSGRTGPDLAASGAQNPQLCTSEGLLHPASIAAQIGGYTRGRHGLADHAG